MTCLIITDEIYAELTYDEAFTSVAAIQRYEGKNDPDFEGFSKGFAVTGWRLGVCRQHHSVLRDAMLKIHQYSMMCAPAVAQYVSRRSFEKWA